MNPKRVLQHLLVEKARIAEAGSNQPQPFSSRKNISSGGWWQTLYCKRHQSNMPTLPTCANS